MSAIAIGICGTDREIVDGLYGQPPVGRRRIVLGHEALGRVVEAPQGSPVGPGDLVVPFVRRPDPVPCPACAIGQWDMCRNGRYLEHGIKELNGFCAERYAVDVDAVVAVPERLGTSGVLIEPASIVAKAWDHVDAIGSRAAWFPARVLVTGAGPIGLLAALLAVQRGYDVHVLDVVESGPKPQLVRDLGAAYHVGSVEEACVGVDIVVECTGVARVVFEVLSCTRPAGIVCLTGVSPTGRSLRIDAGALNREIVLENDVVFGTVNANAAHYRLAVDALLTANIDWLRRMITRTELLEDWSLAIRPREHDVKTAIVLSEA